MTEARASMPAVYTIEADRAFVDELAAGLLRRYGARPEALARVTVLLPNRRAARALRDGFLRVSGGRSQPAVCQYKWSHSGKYGKPISWLGIGKYAEYWF